MHGGNFRDGFAGGLLYDGEHAANASQVVTVSMSYRLGALGFLGSSNGKVKGEQRQHGRRSLLLACTARALRARYEREV